MTKKPARVNQIKLLYPHISRILNERISKLTSLFGAWHRSIFNTIYIVLAGLLLFVLIFNLLPDRGSQFSRIISNILLRPDSPQPHFDLAVLFYQNNDYTRAENELLQALNLGADRTQVETELYKVRIAETEPIELKKEIGRWQKITEKYPGYRDAYLELAILYWKNYQDAEAKDSWQKAYYLDPNNQEIIEVGEVLKLN